MRKSFKTTTYSDIKEPSATIIIWIWNPSHRGESFDISGNALSAVLLRRLIPLSCENTPIRMQYVICLLLTKTKMSSLPWNYCSNRKWTTKSWKKYSRQQKFFKLIEWWKNRKKYQTFCGNPNPFQMREFHCKLKIFGQNKHFENVTLGSENIVTSMWANIRSVN